MSDAKGPFRVKLWGAKESRMYLGILANGKRGLTQMHQALECPSVAWAQHECKYAQWEFYDIVDGRADVVFQVRPKEAKAS